MKNAAHLNHHSALWWFRWAAFFTFLTGLILIHQITARIGTEIILGVTMGTIMMLNVWGIIWRNQKIVLGLKDGDVATAAAKAGLLLQQLLLHHHLSNQGQFFDFSI